MAFVAGAVLTAESLNAFRTTTLGVGTTTPITTLEINSDDDLTAFEGTGRGSVTITNSDYAAGDYQAIDFCYSPDVAPSARIAGQMTGSGSYLMFGTTNSYGAGVTNTAMTVNPAGQVGIGTTAPAELLHVGDGSTAGSFRVHANAGSESFRVVTSVVRSKTIVDLTSASAANVFINSANNTLYRSTSSIKYKSPVEDLDDAYADRVLEMRPVWYRSITGNDPAGHSYYGLISEEVAAIDPRLVTFGPLANCVCPDDPDDPGVTVHTPECSTEPEGVQYDRLVPHLISVAQRQAAALAALTARLEALEA